MKKSLFAMSAFALFAGAAMAENVVNEGGWNKEIYGSLNEDGASVSTRITGGEFSSSQLYGGKESGSTVSGGSTLYVEDGTFGNGWNGHHMWLYGGSAENSTVSGDSAVRISGGTFAAGYGYIYGGSNGGVVNGNSGVYITGGSFAHYDIYGGGAENSVVNGNTYLEISGAEIKSDLQVGERFGGQIFLGGNDNSVVKGNASLYYNAKSDSTTIYLSGRNNSVIEGTVSAQIGKDATFWGMGACGEIRGNNVVLNSDGSVASVIDANKNVISVSIDGAVLNTSVQTTGDNYGPKNIIYGSSSIVANDSTITKMRGAFGTRTVVKGNSTIELNNSNVTDKIYVGSDTALIEGNANLTVNGGSVKAIYGGYGNADTQGVVNGNLNILLNNAAVEDIYLAGKGNSLIKGKANLTLTGSTTVSGTITANGLESSGKTPEISGEKTLYLGTEDSAYTGSAGDIVDFDKIVVAKGSNASAKSITHNFEGNIAGIGSHNYVQEGANFTVEGDIVNTLNNATNSGSFVGGLTSSRVDQKSAGSAIVKGTVKTIIDGENTKLNLVYGGNGGNQKGTLPHLKGMMESSAGAVDLTVNNGYMAMILGSGAMFSDVAGNVDIKINGGKIDGVYGVASNANVGGNVNVTMLGGTITGDKAGDYVIGIAAGGANNGDSSVSDSTISGSTNIVLGGTALVKGDVFGGGWGGYTNQKCGGLIKGDTNITLKGGAVVEGTIYGGGVAGYSEIQGSKNLNIGTAEESYSSTIRVADFNKINVVNGSVEFASFKQASEGTLINIAQKASLTASLNSADQFNNTSIENDGMLVLKRGKLADNDSVALKNYSGTGTVSAYGGIFENGTFTVGKSQEYKSSAITVGSGKDDVQSVNFNGKLALDFDVSNLGEAALTVNEVKVADDISGIDGKVLAAYEVSLADNGNDYSVVFSAYIGAIEDISKLSAWHKGKDGEWTKIDSVIEYADEIASIVVDGFSSYAFAMEVPEPSTYAAIFGLLALGLVVYRRRK